MNNHESMSRRLFELVIVAAIGWLINDLLTSINITIPFLSTGIVFLLILAFIIIEYQYRILRSRTQSTEKRYRRLTLSLKELASELDELEATRYQLEQRIANTNYFSLAEEIIQIETLLLKHRKLVMRLQKILGQSSDYQITEFLEDMPDTNVNQETDNVDFVEKELKRSAREIYELNNELFEIQERLNLRRLKDLETDGKRIERLKDENIIPPNMEADIKENNQDDENNPQKDSSD